MARINLLPWREERRRERTRRFGIAMVVGVAVSAAVIAAVHLYQDRIDRQNGAMPIWRSRSSYSTTR